MTDEPNDFMIFGKAEAIEFDRKKHMAPKAEIERDVWNQQYPCLLHIENPVFIDATLGDCISLFGMIDELGHKSFASTKRNYEWNRQNPAEDAKNVDPRRSLRQQAGMYLTPRAAAWLDKRIEKLVQDEGRIPEAFINALSV